MADAASGAGEDRRRPPDARIRTDGGEPTRGDTGDPESPGAGEPGVAGDLSTVLERITDGVLAFDTEFRITYLNERAAALIGVDREAAVGEPMDELFPGVLETTFAAEYRRALDTQEPASFEEYYAPLETWFAVRAYPSETGLSVYFRDVTERVERERELERLARLDRVVRGVNRALVDTASRAEIERTVCDRLAGGDDTAFAFAWIGRADGDRVEPTAYAGDPGMAAALEREAIPLDEGPVGSALTRDDATVIVASDEDNSSGGDSCGSGDGCGGGDGRDSGDGRDNGDGRGDGHVGSDSEGDEGDEGNEGGEGSAAVDAWRETPLAGESAAVAAIPLCSRSTRHGVLCLHAASPDALAPDESAAALEQLRDVVGLAISAAECRASLVSDETVELEFRVHGDGGTLVGATRGTDARLAVERVCVRENGVYRADVRIAGPDAGAVHDRLRGCDGVLDVATHAGGDRLAIRLSGCAGTVVSILADHGASLAELDIEDGVGTAVATLSGAADVRSVFESLDAVFDRVDLRAKREGVPAASDDGASAVGALTDRQREALETAFRAGYFDWPREHHAEDVADELGVTSPTFHEHLRTAQRKLLDGLLDG